MGLEIWQVVKYGNMLSSYPVHFLLSSTHRVLSHSRPIGSAWRVRNSFGIQMNDSFFNDGNGEHM